MRTAIIATQSAIESDETIARAEADAALAIGKELATRNFNPWLVCNPDSALASMAVPIPRFCIDPAKWLYTVKLWQWQRLDSRLLILCIGHNSLKLGKKLFKMGKKDQRQLIAVFFLSAPSREDTRLLLDAQGCICGSSFITSALAELTSAWKKQPQIIASAPGIDISKYNGQQFQSTSRFIFGMDGSLLPHSGALMIVRAMAALWQHEDLPKWEVRMFGSGPRFAEIMEEAEKLGVLPRLAILDSQPLPEVIRYCHAWLAPGTSETEMPWILWAGFAARIPVICTSSALHKERVWAENAVIPIATDNPQDMARAMLNIMRDPQLCANTVQAAMPMLPQIALGGMAKRVSGILTNFMPATLSAPAESAALPPASGNPAK